MYPVVRHHVGPCRAFRLQACFATEPPPPRVDWTQLPSVAAVCSECPRVHGSRSASPFGCPGFALRFDTIKVGVEDSVCLCLCICVGKYNV